MHVPRAVQVRGDPAGLRRDKALGMVRLPLGTLLEQHPQLGTGDEVEVRSLFRSLNALGVADMFLLQ